jgi:hypothetical protein
MLNWMRLPPVRFAMFTLGGLAVAHAVAAEQFSVMHSTSVDCDDVRAPGPEFPDEGPQAPRFPVGSVRPPAIVNGTVTALTPRAIIAP